MPRKSRYDKVTENVNDDEKVRVVISTRISVDRDTEQSIHNQMRECREYAKAQGWEIVGEFVDRGKSAYKLETVRPGFDDALRMIETGKANRLLIWKLDRMTRNARGFMRIHDQLTEWGATFNSVKEPWFDTSTPIGLALVMLMAALAEMEAEGIQGRAISWHIGRIEKLMPPIGNRPFGYNRDKGPNTLTINPKEQKLVVEMAERILGGDGLRGIARDFTSREIPTACAKPTTKWSHTTVRSIMRNPTTAGLVEVGKNEYVPSPNWEPLIDPDMWHEVNAILADPERASNYDELKTGRRGKVKYMLPGLMACGRCGGKMTSAPHKYGRRYSCQDCEMSIDGVTADTTVGNWILENVTEQDWAVKRAQGKGRETVEEIQGRINEAFMERTVNPNRVPLAIYENAMAQLEAQLAAAESDAATEMPDVKDLHGGWSSMPPADQRIVIGAFIESITVAPHGKGCTGDKRIRIEGIK